MEEKNKKIRKEKKKVLNKWLIVIPAIILVIIFGLYVWFINKEARGLEKYTEITFVSPNQAIVFWKSEEPTLGYVIYGDTKHNRKEVELQTTSEPSDLHIVFLERIPPEGIYISKHLDSANMLIFPIIEFIQYNNIEQEYE